MASVVPGDELSTDYQDFKAKLDMLHPAYNETLPLDFVLGRCEDDEQGL